MSLCECYLSFERYICQKALTQRLSITSQKTGIISYTTMRMSRLTKNSLVFITCHLTPRAAVLINLAFCGLQIFPAVITRAYHRILSWAMWIQCTVLKPASSTDLAECLFTSDWPHQNFVFVSVFTSMYKMPCPPNTPSFHYPTNLCFEKDTNHETLLLSTLIVCSSLNDSDQFS